MSIFRRGGPRAAGPFLLTYFDRRCGKTQRRSVSTGVAERSAAVQIEKQLKRLVQFGIAGEQVPQDLVLWAQSTSMTVQNHLIKHALMPAEQIAGGRQIKELIEQYMTHCTRLKHNPKYLITKRTQLDKLAEAAGDVGVRSLKTEHLEAVMDGVILAGRSARTANQHRMSAIAFGTWLEERKILDHNPFKRVSKQAEASDRRLVRRAATPVELQKLFDAAPPHRAAVYVAFALTGLRRNEMRQMTWGDLDLADGTIRVRAEISKSGKEATIPLHPQLAAVLAASRSPKAGDDDPWFKELPRAKTFYKDLAVAGIAKFNAAGKKLDVHALRGTLGTNLARRGVPMPVVQRLLRHASMETTAKYYTHLEVEDLRSGVERMPDIAAGVVARRMSGQANALKIGLPDPQRIAHHATRFDRHNNDLHGTDRHDTHPAEDHPETTLNPHATQRFSTGSHPPAADGNQEHLNHAQVVITGAVSSVGQSAVLTPRMSQVRALHGPLSFHNAFHHRMRAGV